MTDRRAMHDKMMLTNIVVCTAANSIAIMQHDMMHDELFFHVEVPRREAMISNLPEGPYQKDVPLDGKFHIQVFLAKYVFCGGFPRQGGVESEVQEYRWLDA